MQKKHLVAGDCTPRHIVISSLEIENGLYQRIETPYPSVPGNHVNIALVNSEFPSVSAGHGGITTYTLTLSEMLARRGHTVHVLLRSGFAEPAPVPGVVFHHFGQKPAGNPVMRFLERHYGSVLHWEIGQARAAAGLLSGLVAKCVLDVVEYPEYGGLAAFFPKFSRVPCVITFHMPSELVDTLNDAPPPSRQRRRLYAMERASITRATACKSPSAALKAYVCERFHTSPQLIEVVRNPLDTSDLDVIPQRLPDPSRFDILFCGRLERRKGADLLLHSIKEILSIDESVTFTVAGESGVKNGPDYRDAIERTLSPCQRRRVCFPGPLSREKLLPLYRNSSLFLFLSIFENSPYALLEAMASGLPVIASSGGGTSEMIDHEINGLLFSPGNRSELLSHIRECFNRREWAQNIGRNANLQIRKLFDPDKRMREHVDFYASSIERSGMRR